MPTTPLSDIDLPLADVLAATGGALRGGNPRLHFSNVAVDSRLVTPGALFVALRGEHVDGHQFVAEALARGARGALVERLPPPSATEGTPDSPALICVPDTYRALQDLGRYWRARISPVVVGITGSVGKTTTKEAIAEVLAQRFTVLRSEGNLNTEVGMPLMLLRARPSHQVLVLEMGAYNAGDIRLLAEIARPSVGVVTSVQPVHLERLGSIERIQQTKQELVEALPANGVAVLNADDVRVRAMATATRARVRTFGLSPDAEVRAEGIVGRGLGGVDFTLVHGDCRLPVHLALLGRHTVYAALAAVVVGLALGLPLEEAAAGLGHIPASVRILVRPGLSGALIVDDTYNASPESALAALNLLAELDGRRVAVLGDMLELGSYEEPGHRRVGSRAGEVADVLVTVGPRARWIAEEARRMSRPPATIVEANDRAEAFEQLRRILQPGDVVLVKGSRAMQMEHLARALRDEAGGH